MKYMQQRHFIQLTLIFLVVLIVIAAKHWYVEQDKSSDQSNWRTYDDSCLSFKYPKDWTGPTFYLGSINVTSPDENRSVEISPIYVSSKPEVCTGLGPGNPNIDWYSEKKRQIGSAVLNERIVKIDNRSAKAFDDIYFIGTKETVIVLSTSKHDTVIITLRLLDGGNPSSLSAANDSYLSDILFSIKIK